MRLPPRRLSVRHLAILAAGSLVAAGAISVRPVLGGFSASVSNSGDHLQTGSVQLEATSSGSAECDQGTSGVAIQGADTATCSGSLLPSGALPSSGSSSLSTVVTDQGSLTASRALVEDAGGSCGAVALADQADASDPMLVRNQIEFSQPGPLNGSASIGLSGSDSYASDVAGMAGPANTSFTIAIWFKTTSTAGGTLIGFANTPIDTGDTQADRMLWIDNSGKVVFGVQPPPPPPPAPPGPPPPVELTTPGSYNNGGWHLAVASMSTSAGLSLSVDAGTPVTDTSVTSLAPYNGYWHVGWDDETNGWSDAPTNPFFTGDLSDAAIFPTALTSSQISALYSSGSQSSWQADLSSDGAGYSWNLADTGSDLYSGALPGVSAPTCYLADVGVPSAPTPAAVCPSPGEYPNFVNPADPMCPSGSATYGSWYSPSGTNGFAADAEASTAPGDTSFTMAIWFETTSTSGGTLIGFNSQPGANPSSEYDKILWIDNAGHVVFGAYNGNTVEVKSTGTYNDGNWHLAVASISTTTGMSLIVDNSPPVTSTSLTSSLVYSGYWHVGWDGENSGWPDGPTDPYFDGSLADAAVFSSVLSPPQVASLYTAGSSAASQGAWDTDLALDGAVDSWVLDGQPLAYQPETLANLASASVTQSSLPNTSATYSFSVSQDATYDAANFPDAAGLNLSLPLTILVYAGGDFDAGVEWPTEDVIVP